ncbi:hypothetical protein PV325_001832 [Microctonus aethiopoides]|nr:hypothetical protein PV325_001832 [Microctonus aethiopoides]
MTEMFGSPREAVRVKVKKCETRHQPEYRKFSVDPQITSIEVLQSILIKAFDIKGEFTVSYRAIDDYGSETYLFLLSDWDLDAAFISASEPYLYLQVNLKPFGESGDCDCDWEQSGQELTIRQHQETGFPYKTPKLPGLIMNKMERTLNMVQRALGNLGDENSSQQNIQPPRPPLTDAEFRRFLDPIGQVIHSKELRAVIYFGGIEPSLRKVVWKHILNVYPEGMSGRERMDYMKQKAHEYQSLREKWRGLVQKGQNIGDLSYVTSMVRKDVLRTDRHHKFYAGSDDNQNIASLFNILTTYALNHPSVSYCQGMSDLASSLLVTMRDEAQAYICLCALMRRLKDNFMLDGIAMTTKFTHLAEGLQHYDPEFYAYLKLHQADDLLFCYRWLLLEMKREFALEDALRMLEVLWAALPATPPKGELSLAEVTFPPPSPPPSPNVKHIRENAYTKVCAIRRLSSSASIVGGKKRISSTDENPSDANIGEDRSTPVMNTLIETESMENHLTSTKNRKNVISNDRLTINDLSTAKLKSTTNGMEKKNEKSTSQTNKNSELTESEKKCARVVKNLNEFLNFTSLNRSKVGSTDERELRRVSSENGVINVMQDDASSPDDPTDFFPMTTSMTRELRLELESLDRQVFGPSSSSEGNFENISCDKKNVYSNNESETEAEAEMAQCSPATDVFVWENPLHTMQQKNSTYPTTPDEQTEIEYDGEILEDQNGIKSVTPIRLLKCTPRSDSASDSEATTDSLQLNTAAPESPLVHTQEQGEEATELTALIPAGTCGDDQFTGGGSLPPPSEFGGGNPFLMFLCITLLLQHRDFIMRNQMDYNEMAMHFDKMVRRHNVAKVLNQARQLFAGYLRRHSTPGRTDYVSV